MRCHTGRVTLAAVLWDMDGTLVRTEELWLESEVRTMAHFGSHWDAQDQAVAVGGPMERVIGYMARRVGRPEVEVETYIVREIADIMRAEHIPWMPGAQRLHQDLAAEGIPQALVSNSWRDLMDTALSELHTSFDVTIAGDEVPRPKPDPMPYEVAAAHVGADPRDCVVLEDSPTGVQAALSAGCHVIGVPHVGSLRPDPRLLVVDSLTQVSVAMIEAWSRGESP